MSGATLCDTSALLHQTFLQFSEEKSFVYVSQRRETETEEQLCRAERQYGVVLHRIYGEDFEEAYLTSRSKAWEREDKAV